MSDNPTTGPVEDNGGAENAEPLRPVLPPISAPDEPIGVAPAASAAQRPPVQPLPDIDATRLDLSPAVEPEATPLPEEPAAVPKKKRKAGKAVALTLGSLVVAAGAVYAGGAFFTQDKLPAHLSVDGVDLSGLSADEAKAKLTNELVPRAQQAIKLTAGEQSVALKPADAGLGVNVDSTIDRLTGLSWEPSVILSRVFGTQDTEADTSVDQAALTAAVKKAADSLSTKPVEGSIAISQGKAEYNEPRDGVAVDPETTAASLEKQWLHSDGVLTVTSSALAPAVSAADFKSFLDSSVAPLLDGDVTVNNGSATASLSPTAIGDALSVSTKDAKPVLAVDGEKLVSSVVEANSKMASEGKNATIKLAGKGGSASVSVVPSQQGKGVDAAALAAAVQEAAKTPAREAKVELQVTEPTVSTKQAQAWKMVKVAEFETVYPTYDTQRTKNLVAGSAKVSGTVVEPGEEFNLADAFGPITTANGYYSSGVVEDGVSTTAMGGGLSQIATMSYNAGFLSGMDILEHKPHSRWFDRYPAGRESTYWEGKINVRWKNNTKAPVAVEMWVTDSKVKMAVWGVKTWNVTTKTSEHYNFTSGATIHSNKATCTPENSGIRGFTVNVTRDRKSATTTLPHEVFTWSYVGWPHVICD